MTSSPASPASLRLARAVRAKNAHHARQALADGADPNTTIRWTGSPPTVLQYALASHQNEVVEDLLIAGASPTDRNENGAFGAHPFATLD